MGEWKVLLAGWVCGLAAVTMGFVEGESGGVGRVAGEDCLDRRRLGGTV